MQRVFLLPGVAAAVAVALLASCAVAGPASVEQAWADVLQKRGDTRCSSDAQCHSIGVGSQPCGGPGEYLAWSSQRNDGVALAAAVQRHAALAKVASRTAGRMSICAVVPDPGAVCTGTVKRADNATDNAKRCELHQR